MKIAREDLTEQMEQRIPASERTHLPAVSVFRGLRPKVD
jgi:hypothetical protein